MATRKGKAVIDEKRCKGCELCVDACTQKVLVLSKNIGPYGHYPVQFLDENRCTACRLCVIVCPDVAITLYQLDPVDTPR